MTTWADLETTLDPDPEFFVEAPDDRRDWTEIQRQATFLSLMRHAAPRVLVYANANAGKRNPQQAKREGIRAGVPDLCCVWRGKVAWLEFKGWSGKRPRAGTLSRQQIEFGNRLHQLGHPVACFFSPHRAVDWLRDMGFPIAEITT